MTAPPTVTLTSYSHDVTTTIDQATTLLADLAPGGAEVPIREPLQTDESRWFLRAVADGVVEFHDCPDDCFRFKKWAARGPDHFDTPDGKPRHLFSKPTSDPAWLNREYVSHIAAYARAILDFGYDQSRSSFSLYRSFSRDVIVKKEGQNYETDAEFYDADDRIYLHVEAKAEPRQIDKIVAQLDAGTPLSELPRAAVKEIEYVLDLEPRYLWVVGPGSVDPAPFVYEVTVDGNDAHFDRLAELPAPPD